jgi:hypothetical protein
VARSLAAVASLCLVGVATAGVPASSSGPAPPCELGGTWALATPCRPHPDAVTWATPVRPPAPVPQVAPAGERIRSGTPGARYSTTWRKP